MGKSKSEIAINVATNLGSKFEDMLDAVRVDVAKFEGMKVATAQLIKVMERQTAAIDAEASPDNPNEEARSIAKRHVGQCLSAANNMASNVDSSINVGRGKLAALEVVVKEVEKLVNHEKNRLKALEEAEASGTGEFQGPAYRRPVGVRPADQVAARRAESEPTVIVIEDGSAPTNGVSHGAAEVPSDNSDKSNSVRGDTDPEQTN